jgi:hypothetical protein
MVPTIDRILRDWIPFVSQLTIVVIDTSSTMTIQSQRLRQRKSTVAKALLAQFADEANRLRPPGLFGLTFYEGHGVAPIQSGINLPREFPDENGGSVTPWMAICATIQQIQTVTAFSKWTKKILLITDGDAPIEDTAIEACQSLLRTDIILDALVLGPMSPIRMAVFYSGGRAFGLDGAEFEEFLKLEEFIDLNVRLRPQGNWKPAEITKELLTIDSESPPFDTTVGLTNPYPKFLPSVPPEKLNGTNYRER